MLVILCHLLPVVFFVAVVDPELQLNAIVLYVVGHRLYSNLFVVHVVDCASFCSELVSIISAVTMVQLFLEVGIAVRAQHPMIA
jgi:hypothetical protein